MRVISRTSYSLTAARTERAGGSQRWCLRDPCRRRRGRLLLASLGNHLLNSLAKPHRRLWLQLDEFFPLLVGQDHGDDVFAIGVHGEAFLFTPGLEPELLLLDSQGYLPGSIEK